MTEPSTDKNPLQFDNWVKKLQKQSWELELLVTGFSIFLLLQVPQTINQLANQMTAADNSVTTGVPVFLLSFVSLSAQVIAFNLVILIVLRAIWIGYVGLSSVFPQGIRPEKINVSDFQRQKMRHLYGDNNRHIIRLDKLSSTLFSFSFLIACFIFSLGVIIILTILLVYYSSFALDEGNTALAILYYGLFVLLYLSPLLKLLDLITLGKLHANEKLAKVLYYLHWSYGWLTLFHLYAPVYYILISNYNRIKIKLLIVGYVGIIFVMAAEVHTQGEIYSPTHPQFDSEDYDNLRQRKSVIRTASLATDVVEKDHVKLFIRFVDLDNTLLVKRCPELADVSGQIRLSIFNASINIGADNKTAKERRAFSQKALSCIGDLYRLSINDKPVGPLKFAWRQRDDNYGEKGVVTLVPLKDLAPGLHMLQIQKARSLKTPEKHLPWVNISFWKM